MIDFLFGFTLVTLVGALLLLASLSVDVWRNRRDRP